MACRYTVNDHGLSFNTGCGINTGTSDKPLKVNNNGKSWKICPFCGKVIIYEIETIGDMYCNEATKFVCGDKL